MSNQEEAVEAVVLAIARENFWDADAPEVRRGLEHRAEIYVAAAYPALRSQIEEETREKVHDFYAPRLKRIEDAAKEAGIWDEVACIMANGRAAADEPPTYAQRLNLLKAEAAKTRSQIERELGERLLSKEASLAAQLAFDEQAVEWKLHPGVSMTTPVDCAIHAAWEVALTIATHEGERR